MKNKLNVRSIQDKQKKSKVFEKYLVNINSNGLLSIPKKLRDELGLLNDSKIPILFSGKQIIINAEENQSLINRAREIQRKFKSENHLKKFVSYQESRSSATPDEVLEEIGGML